MIKTKTFPVAGIYFDRGMLVINSTKYNNGCKHYEVKAMYDTETGIFQVDGERALIGVSFSKGSYPVKQITENSIEDYKPWPWSKQVKRRSKIWVEFLKRESVTYTSNHYTIID